MLTSSLLLLTLTTGCASTTKLHIIEKHHVVSMPKGESYTPLISGWFVSDFYMKEIMKAKIDD